MFPKNIKNKQCFSSLSFSVILSSAAKSTLNWNQKPLKWNFAPPWIMKQMQVSLPSFTKSIVVYQNMPMIIWKYLPRGTELPHFVKYPPLLGSLGFLPCRFLSALFCVHRLNCSSFSHTVCLCRCGSFCSSFFKKAFIF